MNSMLFCHEGELFAVRALARHPVTEPSFHVRFQTKATTAGFGQRLFVALLEQETLSMLPGSPGIGLCIDPETGAVEDVVNEGGVIGYVTTAPQEPGQTIELAIEAHIYGKVMIPCLRVGNESVIHPAILLENGPKLTGFAGSEIMNGAGAEFQEGQFIVNSLSAAVAA